MSSIIDPEIKSHHRVRELDFRRPMKFARDHLRQLERAHENFARSASSRLSAELRCEVQIELATNDQLPYSAVMAEEVPSVALALMLQADGLKSGLVLVVETSMAKTVVNRVLGGSDTASTDTSEMTEIDMRFARYGLSGLVQALSASWEDLCGVSLIDVGVETNPVVVQVAPPQEPTLVLTFSVTMDGATSLATLIIPHRAVSDQLAGMSAYSADEAPPSERTISRELQHVEVPVSAVAGSASMSVADLLMISPGDVVRLDRRYSDGVLLTIDGQAVAEGSPGTFKHRRSVQIS